MFAGIYHWFPRIFGRMMNKTLGYFHFWITFVTAYLVFFPMHFMGLAGVPRRYYQFTLLPEFDVWMDVNILITVSALIAGAAQLLFIYNFFYSIFKGPKSVQNPWESNTLEWSSPAVGIHGNWSGAIPEVFRGPHEYARPDIESDFFPKYEPDETAPEVYEPNKTKPVPKKEEEPSAVFFSAIKKVFGFR